ncbi:glycosyltransferase family 9 protein [Nocardiopsis dassonvillei]|uniref:glycosyltransferase family 9 protein n=1 Tax=Nocardiopsis dassonvillei TaxID=2014 RepID=UPI003F543544
MVSRSLGLGDFVTAVPALRALEGALPEWRRVLAGPPWYRHLLRLAGLRWEVLPTEALHVPEPRPPVCPDLAVNLHGRGPQSTAALDALAPRRLWTYEHPDAPQWPGPPWPEGLHDADVWAGLTTWHGLPADPRDLLWPVPEAPYGNGRPTAVVHPGASSPARRWPPERFALVAARLAGLGLHVVVTGSRQEVALAERVADAAGLPQSSVLAGRTSLSLLAGLVAHARLLVCGDTGVAHLATAYATPSVRLFGPVPPALWGPRRDEHLHTCLWSGRRGDPHGRELDPGLALVEPEEVLSACRGLLDAAPAGSSAGPSRLHAPVNFPENRVSGC